MNYPEPIALTDEIQSLVGQMDDSDREFVAGLIHESFPPSQVSVYTVASLRRKDLDHLKARIDKRHELPF